jgi:hypothetical protein
MKKILLLVLANSFSFISIGQSREIAHCGNGFADNSAQITELIQNNRTSSNNNTIFRIPVVFHILTNEPNGESNISDCIIRNQVEILNNCFRRKSGAPNTNAAGADAQIEFYLARKNNSGAAISGINRVTTQNCNYTDLNSSTQVSAIRGAVSASSNWPNNKYLNIFVLKTMPNNNRTRGRAWWGGGSEMGVFVHYSYVGSKNSGCSNISYLDNTGFKAYDLGMTLVHEVGHYLDLLHTYGSTCTYTDGCGDTPAVTGLPDGVVGTSNANCSKNDSKGVCNTAQKRMWQNYLDYTDDLCMDRFTPNQVTRMRNILTTNSIYINIVSQNNFTATGGDIATSVNDITTLSEGEIKVYPNPFTNKVTLISKEIGRVRQPYRILNVYGQELKRGILNSNTESVNLSDLSDGIYFVEYKKQSFKIIKQE